MDKKSNKIHIPDPIRMIFGKLKGTIDVHTT